jgi:CMP-N-acetylneuraminic acid synthetase
MRLVKESTDKILIVIPARGGSKGIPRKNLSILNGRPLLSYAIQTALGSRFTPDVVVSSDDEEILQLAVKLGAKSHRREAPLAGDACTLDPVIFDAYKSCSVNQSAYALIVTLQPTSPLLKSSSLDRALEQMLCDQSIDTLISARDDTHLTWRKEGGRFVPNYTERVNRQYLPQTFRETGAFLITRPSVISEAGRIGRNVELFLLAGGEEIDIDTYEDWSLCEFFLRRKNVLFVVAGHNDIGLGHVCRALLLASGILNHRVRFLVDRHSQLAFEKIAENNYEVHIQQETDILADIARLEPDVVINDILDTDQEYILELKRRDTTVINFEDLGQGAQCADLVINALYPEHQLLPNHYFGDAYFCARDEFIYSKNKLVDQSVSQILVTFGGVDSNNLTRKVLTAIYEECRQCGIAISVVLGLGYRQQESLDEFVEAGIRQDVRNISEEMLEADIVFTSAGRTVYELACIGTPTIVLAQNEREMTHFFASADNGFLNLGLGADLSAEDILVTFKRLLGDFKERQRMCETMLERQVRSGRKKVLRLMQQAIEENV